MSMGMRLDPVFSSEQKEVRQFPGVALKLLVQEAQAGLHVASAEEEMISVIVKVSDLELWKKLEGVKTRVTIPQGSRWIVTAEIPFSRAEAIQQDPCVLNMEIPTRVWAAKKESESIETQEGPSEAVLGHIRQDITISMSPVEDFDLISSHKAKGIIYGDLIKSCESRGILLSDYGNHAGAGSLMTVEDYENRKKKENLFNVDRIQKIFAVLRTRLRPNSEYVIGSYSLKHRLEYMPGQDYLTNGDLIAAMLLSGYEAKFEKRTTVNCIFQAEIVESDVVMSIPSTLEAVVPNRETPWAFSPEVSERMQGSFQEAHIKVEITPDVSEYSFVKACYEHSAPVNRIISRVWCVYNPTSTVAFEKSLSAMEAQGVNPACQPNWREKNDAHLRYSAYRRWSQISKLFSPFKSKQSKNLLRNITILPLWHGTSEERGKAICNGGFSFFGLEDEAVADKGQAMFGNGLYFTNSAQHASTYSSDGTLLLGWVSMQEPYPVGLADIEHLKGKAAVSPYNAYYVPVAAAQNDQSLYYPCDKGQDPQYDEFVVFQPVQTLVRFLVKIEIALLPSPALLVRSATIQELSKEILWRLEREVIRADQIPCELVQRLGGIGRAAYDRLFIMPELAFGKAKWAKFFGIQVEEPPLPFDIHDILAGPCPIFPGKKMAETHFLKLIPEDLNLERLESLTQNPVCGNKTIFESKDRGAWSQHNKTLSGKTHWVLMTKEIIPDSLGKSWRDQQELVEKKYRAKGYKLLSGIEVATCLLLEYVEKGSRFYTSDLSALTRCVEQVVVGPGVSWPLTIGSLPGGYGFSVSYVSENFFSRLFYHARLGVGITRNFF